MGKPNGIKPGMLPGEGKQRIDIPSECCVCGVVDDMRTLLRHPVTGKWYCREHYP